MTPDEVKRAAGQDARLVIGGMVDRLERGHPVEKQAVSP